MQRTAALLFFLLLTEALSSQVVINEIGIAPPGGNGSQFTELFNRSGCAVDLSCYTLVFSSTSGGGNPTGWTVKIPSGKSIAAGGYFLIGGTAGVAGVSGGTGYPTGGVVNSYSGIADVDVGTMQMTSNAVYMKQFLAAGSFPNTKGQLSLLDAAGNLVASVSYNNGNDASTYPLSAYNSCAVSGNGRGANNVPAISNTANNVSSTFTAATNQGIYLSSSGTYAIETSLTPGASNAGNGGTQICTGPVLNSITNIAVCFSTSNQTVILPYSATNSPIAYSLGWSAAASTFATINNAAIAGNISIVIPGNTPAGVYTGYLFLTNACGSSCTKPFLLTVNPPPVASAGSYAPVCINSSPIVLNGTPTGGNFSGANVAANNFTPPNTAGAYVVSYSYTDPATGCSNNAATTINVLAPASTYTTACTNSPPFVFFGQPLSTTGLHTVFVNNASGCADTARVYLVVKQTINIDTAACDSVFYNGTMYYNDAMLSQTISSTVTACDSLVKNIRIRVKRPGIKDTAVCLPPNGSLNLLGQVFVASGNYVLHTTNTDGCDSTIRLQLTVAALQTQLHTDCDSVQANGQTYYVSTTFLDTLRSQQGCDSLIRTHNIVVNHPLHVYINACVALGQTYIFNGQALNTSGSYIATLNGRSCDSVVHLRLIVAQHQNVIYQACNTYTYNGITYTSSTTLRDTLRAATGCDSVLRTIQIIIASVLHTYLTACIPQGQVYLFNNQVLSITGIYTAQFATAGGCDSIVQLYLTVSATQTQNMSGCDSLLWKGKLYRASTRIIDTARSVVSGCDSLYLVTNIVIAVSPVQQVSVCLGAGQSYVFNGQALNRSGQYTAVFTRPGLCDSTVHLELVIPLIQQQTISGCGTVVYKGIAYASSTLLKDTLRSINLCDSIYRVVQINVLSSLQTFTTACIREGQSYSFNGQVLTASGAYTTTYQTPSCDSIVHLYLNVTQTRAQLLQDCDTVVYKGVVYTTSTALSDTVKSTVTQCDSIINLTTITVNKKPVLTVGRDTTICRLGTATLSASSATGIVNWTGFVNSNAVVVSPQTTTQYFAVAVDTNGCTNSMSTTVFVQDFSVALSADKNPSLSGTTVVLQSTGNFIYSIASWQPTSVFVNQWAKSQQLTVDTSMTVTIVAQTLIGCKDSATVQLTAIPLDEVYIPSAFTANGDGRNDEVKVIGTAIKELRFTVFNRWGQLIFYTTDKSKGWDGKFKGSLQPAGAYVYVARIIQMSGRIIEKKGTVTLIK